MDHVLYHVIAVRVPVDIACLIFFKRFKCIYQLVMEFFIDQAVGLDDGVASCVQCGNEPRFFKILCLGTQLLNTLP